MSVLHRLETMGISLPATLPANPVFQAYVKSGNLLFISGQLPLQNGLPVYVGAVPEQVSIDEAREAARVCVVNILSVVLHATGGDLEKISQVVKVGGFVATSSSFADAPRIINAASEFLNEVFREKGRHSRFAIGVASLPLNVPVEVEAIFELSA